MLALQPIVEVLHDAQQMGRLPLGPVGDELVFTLVQLVEETRNAAERSPVTSTLLQGCHQVLGETDAPGEVRWTSRGVLQTRAHRFAEIPPGFGIEDRKST